MPTLIPVVPARSRRHLHHGDKGNDVKAYGRLVARTLRHAGQHPVNAQNGVYGDGLLKDTLRLQKAIGHKTTGVVDLATWQAVDPQMHAYERLLLELPKPPQATVGDKIAHELEVMYALRLDDYSQDRPGATSLPYPWKRKADCSDSYLLARARAMGVPYNGYGNTTTIWENFAHVDPSDVRRGDAALYGPGWKTTHVQGVVEVKTLMTIGFGSAPGRRAPVHYRSDFMGYRRGA